MLNEEQKKIVEYLRMSPSDPLKRDAANLIERQEAEVLHVRSHVNYHRDRASRLIEMNCNLVRDITALENKKSSIWQAIKEKFK